MAVARTKRTTMDLSGIPNDPYAIAPLPEPIMPMGSNMKQGASSGSEMLPPAPVSMGAQLPNAAPQLGGVGITPPPINFTTATGANVTLPGVPPPPKVPESTVPGTVHDDFMTNAFAPDEAQEPQAPEAPAAFTNLTGAQSQAGDGPIPPPRFQGGGIDLNKWGDPNHQSTKYVVLRLADQYNPMELGRPGLLSPLAAGLRAQLQAQGFRIVDEDQIERADVGTVDILHGDRTEWGWNVGGGDRGPRKPPDWVSPPGPPLMPPEVGGPGTNPPGGGGNGPNGGWTLEDFWRLIGQFANGPRLEPGFAPPGDPGVFDSEFVQQIGQDPLSQLITSGLAGLILEGGTPLSTDVEETLRGIISRRGQVEQPDVSLEPELEASLRAGLTGQDNYAPDELEQSLEKRLQEILGSGGGFDDPNVMRRYESARELAGKAQRTMMNDARGQLATRNLLSEPGSPQGSEIGAVRRIQENIAPEFARAVRDIYSDESERADSRLNAAFGTASNLTGMRRTGAENRLAQSRELSTQLVRDRESDREARLSQSLSLATGMAQNQAQVMLQALGSATERQQALADISLGVLDRNIAWNKFLAEHGLQRDKILNDIQQGRMQAMVPILNAFLQWASLIRGGYI